MAPFRAERKEMSWPGPKSARPWRFDGRVQVITKIRPRHRFLKMHRPHRLCRRASRAGAILVLNLPTGLLQVILRCIIRKYTLIWGSFQDMYSQSHYNSFDLVRFILASSVLLSHHYNLSGIPAPHVPLVDVSLGRFAVFAFFAVSGFLIHNSLMRNNEPFHYFTSRLLRIVPNLCFAVAVTSLALLVLFGNYENIGAHLRYIRLDAASFMAEPSYFIPGLFEDRPDQGVNGSLWTLQYEFFMYIVLFLVFLLPRKITPYLLLAGLVLASVPAIQQIQAGWRVATFHLHAGHLAKTGYHFLAGALIAHYWPYIHARKGMAVLVSTGLSAFVAIAVPQWTIWIMGFAWIPFFVLCLSPIASRFAAFGDASYGVYIFAFPIQQAAILLIPGFWTSMAVSFAATVLISYACWHGFEKRCLSRRKQYAEVLRNRFQRLMGAVKTRLAATGR